MLPPLYTAWMERLLPGPVPEETGATCGDCVMLPREGDRLVGDLHFHPGAKCCSYFPTLPNFLVGQILAGETADAGRETARALLCAGSGVTPLGLDRPPRYAILYDRSAGFGRTPSLVCPYYINADGGLCAIWQHRNGVCATWFCKHVRGAVGEAFWQALQQLLSRIETDLAWWAAVQVDPGAEALGELLAARTRASRALLSAEEIEGASVPGGYARVWGDWLGREEEFYGECARRVAALSWEEVVAACHPAVPALARLVRNAYDRLASSEVPERLRMGPFRIIRNEGSRALAHCYREYDPLSLSRTLLQILPEFDGRPTEEVLAELPAKHGAGLSAALVRKLVDFQVLVPAEE